jgi:hypothetical protein
MLIGFLLYVDWLLIGFLLYVDWLLIGFLLYVDWLLIAFCGFLQCFCCFCHFLALKSFRAALWESLSCPVRLSAINLLGTAVCVNNSEMKSLTFHDEGTLCS